MTKFQKFKILVTKLINYNTILSIKIYKYAKMLFITHYNELPDIMIRTTAFIYNIPIFMIFVKFIWRILIDDVLDITLMFFKEIYLLFIYPFILQGRVIVFIKFFIYNSCVSVKLSIKSLIKSTIFYFLDFTIFDIPFFDEGGEKIE